MSMLAFLFTLASAETHVYQGSWTGSFQGFRSSSGKSISEIHNNSFYFVTELFDGHWESSPSCTLIVSGVEYSASKISFENKNITIKQPSGFPGCTATGLLVINPTLSGSLSSVDCGFQFNITGSQLTEEQIKRPAVLYSFTYSIFSLLTILAYVKHSNDCLSANQARLNSMLTWLLLSILESCLCLWHLHLAFRKLYQFDYFMISCIWSFACLILVKNKILLKIWRSNSPESNHLGALVIRRLAIQFQNRVFFCTLLVMVLVFVLDFLYLLSIFLLHLFFVPQIVKNAKNGYKKPISFEVVLIIAVSKAGLLLYQFACPANALNWEPYPIYAAGLSLVIFLQVAVLFVQRSRPRFFVPSRLRPTVYSYYRSLEEVKDKETDECPICMSALGSADQGSILQTPCGHRFHQNCLGSWMDVRPECPTCRSGLPPIDES